MEKNDKKERNSALTSYDWDTIIMGVENVISILSAKRDKTEIEIELLDNAKKCKAKLLILERKRNAKKYAQKIKNKKEKEQACKRQEKIG